ncbi:reverse transcriptase/maturase family protein [Pontibacter populi]|uniref:Reverse transcriptase/maturase family protein n=1 Tax=Pontibacter populi TaxID=890055 RepID=A0ABV1RX16_9BACT
MKQDTQDIWLKSRGYLHLTQKINIAEEGKSIKAKITNKNFVAKHAFFPLIHCVIKERKFKKVKTDGSTIRKHSYKDPEKGEYVQTAKKRPLHYATHIDSLIFGYYASVLQEKYEAELAKFAGLSKCITAYRRIEHNQEGYNKSTIHFAHEAFEQIKSLASANGCQVLTFDLKSFFSTLDHKVLKRAWYQLFGLDTLPPDHYNVFKAATNFSYVLLDDLRISPDKMGRKSGFDEKRLAELRSKGIQAFFESPEELRNKIQSKELPVFKNPFRNKQKQLIGIPQGLPISAVLANLYLLEFDKQVFEHLVCQLGCYYRRYSDDILIISEQKDCKKVEDFISEMLRRFKVDLSKDKTEKFCFKTILDDKNNSKVISIRTIEGKEHLGLPLNYLGFEFYGDKTLIKSANLAKFYRRMIEAVKRSGRHIRKAKHKSPFASNELFKKRIFKLYSFHGNKKRLTYKATKRLEKDALGRYRFVKYELNKPKKGRGNYFTYLKRASELMQEPSIKRQAHKHYRVLHQAIDKHITQKLSD